MIYLAMVLCLCWLASGQSGQQQPAAPQASAINPFTDVFPASTVVTESSILEFASDITFTLPSELNGKLPNSNHYDFKVSNVRDVELLSWNSDHKPSLNVTYNALSLTSHLGTSSQSQPALPVQQRNRYHLDCATDNVAGIGAGHDLQEWLKNTCASIVNSDAVGKFLATLHDGQPHAGDTIAIPENISLLPMEPKFGHLTNGKLTFISASDSELQFSVAADFALSGAQQNSYSTLKGNLIVDSATKKYRLTMQGSFSGSTRLPDGNTTIPMTSTLSISTVCDWQPKTLP